MQVGQMEYVLKIKSQNPVIGLLVMNSSCYLPSADRYVLATLYQCFCLYVPLQAYYQGRIKLTMVPTLPTVLGPPSRGVTRWVGGVEQLSSCSWGTL